MTLIKWPVSIAPMLKIRLQRVGRKHEPTFRVVLTDSKNSTKSGRFLEVLGSYDPRKNTEVFQGDKIKEWMGKGAQLSDTLRNLLISHKILDGKKVNVLPRKSPIVDEEKLAAEKAAAEEALRKAEEEKKAKEEVVAEAQNVESAPVEELTPTETPAPDEIITEAPAVPEVAEEIPTEKTE